jgi:TP901 family phage tail tape measure protein
LVRVAGIDSQQAVAGLTAAIKGFEGAGLTVAQIADKLAEVDTKFAVSTEDLINGLERASASARVAGVSFDELLAVVTTVQERTQRGGAVIGNAFKTIFARLSRTDTLQTLNQLGIEVLDAQGNVRGAIPLFQELAVELDRLGLQSVKAGDIIQKVAGVRQRDILISLVEDLNSGQSQFAKALGVSATAAGALDAKNAKLNDTLEALINNLTVGGQKLASVLGEIGFTDAAKDILKTLSSVVSGITDILQGESAGAKFAQGLLKGVGSVLTGPGLALISAIFIKLFIDLAKFGKDSIKQILGINRAAQQQAALQQSVLQTLLQNENIQREILALEGNKVAQEQLLLRIYNQQAAALARVQKAAATVTPGLFGAGLRGGTKGVAPKGRASGGYVAAEARDVSRGVGGAPASSKVVSIPNFAFGGGKRGTMVANSSEYYVPNYAGGGDAIFNRDMVRSMGLPSGARKINAAGGYIPNFANRNVGNYGFLIPEMGANRPLKPLDVSIAGKKVTLTGARARGIQPGEAKTVSDPIENRIRKSVIDSSTKYANELQPLGRTVSRADIETGFGTIAGAKGALQAAIGSAFEVGITTALDYKAAIREKGGDFDIRGGANLPRIRKLFGMPASMSIADLKVSDSVGNVESYYSKVMKEIGAGAFTNREKRANARSIALGQLRKKYPQFYTTKGVLKTRGISTADKRRMEDLEARTTSKVLSSRFGNAASGYIPNFVGGALEQAVAREQSAGLPISQIRINQSGKLRNSQNPQGLAVTNTRDEPTGAIPNFAQYPIGVGTRFAPGGGRQRDNIESLSQSAGKASSALDNKNTWAWKRSERWRWYACRVSCWCFKTNSIIWKIYSLCWNWHFIVSRFQWNIKNDHWQRNI